MTAAKCSQCNKPLRPGVGFCPHCGAPANSGKASSAVAKNRHSKKKSARSQQPSRTKVVSKRQVNRRALIIKTVAKSLVKSLALSAAVLGPGLLLLANGESLIGMIWLFVGSFAMMAWTYRKPWRLGTISCLIPPISATVCYLFQLELFSKNLPPFFAIAASILLGLTIGYLRGKAHVVYERNGEFFAERTLPYLVIWIVAYGITLGLGMAASNIWAVYSGLVSGAFTTAMLMVVSILLLNNSGRKSRLRAGANSAIFILTLSPLATAFFYPAPANAISDSEYRKLAADWTRSEFRKSMLPFLGCDFVEKRAGFFTCNNRNLSAESGASASVSLSHGYHVNSLYNRHADRVANPYGATITEIFRNRIGDAYFEEYREPTLVGNEAASGISGHYVLVAEYKNWNFRFDIRQDYQDKVYLNISQARKLGMSVANNLFSRIAAISGQGQQQDSRQEPALVDNPASAVSSSEVTPVIRTPILTIDEVAQFAAGISVILVGAGIAVQIANAIAAALAQAIQAGVELTTEEISEAVAKTPNQPAESGYPQQARKPPPKPKGPVLYDKEGQPFERNEQGEYWAPNDKGRWVWMGEADAREASAALRNELLQRQSEIREHERATDAIREKWRADTQARLAAERAQEAAEREKLRAIREAIEQEGEEPETDQQPTVETDVDVTPGIDNTGVGWGINFAKDFFGGSLKDGLDLITQTPGAIADTVVSAASSAGKALSDPENWRIAAETAIDTVIDVTAPARGDLGGTLKVVKNVAEGGFSAGKVAAHLGAQAWEDKSGTLVAVGKTLLGTENWSKAIDPEVPVTERMGRALWGTVDTGTLLVGVGGAALKGAEKLGNLIRIAEGTEDAVKGIKLIDAAADGTKAIDAAGDMAKSVDAAADSVKSVDAAGDAAKSVDAAEDAVRSADVLADATKEAKATTAAGSARRETLEEMRARLANQKKGPVYTPEGAAARRDGIPNMATDPEGYVRGLPSGALVDRNLANGTGYTGAQIDDMARFAREEEVIVGARSTNVDSMRHIRDGSAVPKPITIKSKTIGELDTYIGAQVEDKGLVGYFKPNQPNPDQVPEHLWKEVNKRYQTRLDEYVEHRDTITKYINEGKMAEKDGKLHAIIRKADGTTELKPYAGDIDGVYFKDAKTDRIIPPGDRYERLKAAWTGNVEGYNRQLAAESAWKGEKPDFVPNYWSKSNAPGQHGVETNLVADIAGMYKPGTPEYGEAVKKATKLHAKLADNHWKNAGEVVMEMRPDGQLRRGIRFTESAPLPDASKGL